MAYDEALADEVRVLFSDRRDVTERRMFGGLAWLVRGNMAVAVRGAGGLMVRVGPDRHEAMAAEPGAEAMVMRGKPMRGWIWVTPRACATQEELATWVRRGLEFSLTLPAK